MANMSTYYRFVDGGLSVCAFLFFALALAIPSGYSYGSVGLLLFALLGTGRFFQKALPAATWQLISLFIGMGCLWGLAFDGLWAWTGTDYVLKYWLAAWTLIIVALWGIRAGAVEWGLSAGAVGALGIASYQYLVLGWAKAWGHTNAIQFGGLAMYLGIAAWSCALLGSKRWYWASLMWLCGACGVIASLLAETRGAWLVAPMLLLCMLIVLCQHGRVRLALSAAMASVVLIAAVVLPFAAKFESRAAAAVQELQQYVQNPQQGAVTSVGQRLEQWRVAAVMIHEQPVTGWGIQGVVVQKQALVDQGLAHPSIMEYGHAHNEILDMWVKRGLPGLVLLLLFYLVPLCLFWPTRQRISRVAHARRPQVLALRMSAALLPIAYFGFGWTQVFFAHNSGNMFYLFAIVAFWGALQHLEQPAALKQDIEVGGDVRRA